MNERAGYLEDIIGTLEKLQGQVKYYRQLSGQLGIDNPEEIDADFLDEILKKIIYLRNLGGKK